jgi:site-specific DNA recombinase
MPQYVIYSRKSLEDDDKQVQSIPDQEAEMKSFAGRVGITVAECLSEAKSAKAPGRLVFNDLMQRVERGEIKGILCWKLDRLARNPVDGGRIIWAIKQHGLVVRTPHQSFSKAEDNLILMYIEFGMAQKYVDDLARNTLRGLESKAKKGWQPGIAPPGYLNSKIEERGNKTIYRDPERFDAVRRMWDYMLTGNYSPARIQKIANEQWGYRTRQTKKTGGKPISRNAVYKIFSNPFYYGRYEYPHGSGNWYDGVHEPMITKAEFDRVQRLLHKDTNPRPSKDFDLPFRGLIKCGACNSSITAHFKEQVRCTKCHYKSSIKNRGSCAKCGLPVADMKNPKIRRYGYYHCTQTLNRTCREKCVSAADLERQVTEKIQPFGLLPELQAWGFLYIEKLRNHDLTDKQHILAEKKRAHDQCTVRLDNLVKLKTAPENADGSLLSDEEYQKQRADLLTQKQKLSQDAISFEAQLNAKTRIAQEILNVAVDINECSRRDDIWKKREVLSALGLNHVLIGKKLDVKPEFPFTNLLNANHLIPVNLGPIEPPTTLTIQRPKGLPTFMRPFLERDLDEDRTKTLKIALKTIWQKLDPSSHIFKRFPLDPNAPVVPKPKRGRNGKFVSIPRDPLESS